MIYHWIAWSLENRLLVAVLVLAVVLGGVWGFFHLSIDAYPDITPEQVLVISAVPGRAAEEIEQQVTIPLELAMGNVPGVTTIRSETVFGLSVVRLVFAGGVDTDTARQSVEERLTTVALPDDVVSRLGPPATGYGEVFRYEIVSDRGASLMDLRTLNEWTVIPQLRRTSGVADVLNFGGDKKEYVLKINPRQLERFALTLEDIVEAVQSNNAAADGGLLRRGAMSLFICGRGLFRNAIDLQETVVKTVQGTPIHIRDVVLVTLDSPARQAIFSKDDRSESVEGIVLMRRGENPSQTLQLLKQAVADLNQKSLPRGVRIEPFYDRDVLVQGTLLTVIRTVVVGLGLVLLIVLLFYGSPMLALLVVTAIPFSLLFALMMLYLTGLPMGLMSIGAINFGLLVDGAVIMVGTLLRLVHRERHAVHPRAPRLVVLQAVAAAGRGIYFSILMIICAYVPLLALTSIEGAFFRPMAITAIFMLIGALLYALFVLPSLATIINLHQLKDWRNPLVTMARGIHLVALRRLLRIRWAMLIVVTVALCAAGCWIVPRIGVDFLPYVDEGDLWIRMKFPAGIAVEQTAEYAGQIRDMLRSYQEVSSVAVQAGRNDSSIEPCTASRVEILVGLRPPTEWRFANKRALIADLGQRLRTRFVTVDFNFTQPIIDSVIADTNGTSAGLAVELSGNDLSALRSLADKTVGMLRKIPGSVDVYIEQEASQPLLVVRPDRERCARYNVQIKSVNRLINTAIGGEPIGTLYNEDRRFPIVARFDRGFLRSAEAMEGLPAFSESGVPILLSDVAKLSIAEGETLIARQGGQRCLTARCDIVGRDQGSFVAEARRTFDAQLKVPADVQVHWLGMFQNLERAWRHFLIVVAATIAIFYVLLVLTFGRHREAVVVLLGVPFAFLGGAVALYLRGMTFNISSGVGFATVFGMCMMGGVLMVNGIVVQQSRGSPLHDAILDGGVRRVRPILMTTLVGMLGLFPASIETRIGSDMQRTMATVIVWGLCGATLATLFFTPILCRILLSEHRGRRSKHGAAAHP